MSFKAGDKVWFVSKYKDKVTGVYVGRCEVEPDRHIVKSTNAFGRESTTVVNCSVPLSALHKLEHDID